MRQSKRKLLSILLTLAMLVGLLPGLGTSALATSTTVTTKTELMNAVKNSGEIVLGADIVLKDEGFDYYLVEIKSGIEITLDLNGHVLDRSRIDLGQNESRGGVIENNGTLVIKDSDPSTPHTLYKKSEAWRPNVYTVEDKSEDSNYTVAATITGGAIIGGYNNYGGGINNSGTLTLEGGTICGNEAGTKGGGVWNQSTGTFTMTGGKICSNKTTGGNKWGGGGVQNDGTFIMTGGTITGNSIQYAKGGGVYNAGTFQISGSPVITGNGNGNVYLMSFSEYDGKPIEVVGALTEDANVGVYPEDTPPITVTTDFKTYMDCQDQTKYFSSDLSGWMVMLDADGEVLLSKPDPVSYVYYTASGTTATKHTDGSCESYTTLTDTTTAWGEGWYVVPTGGVTIADRITVTGEVNLILTDGATLTASSGITISKGNTLNIYAQTKGTGMLIATSASEEAAGIGGGNWAESGGTVTIHGGKVTALGNSWGAGIGGGNGGTGGMVTIYDGNVTATGGSYEWGGGGAGIGGGFEGDGSTVTIYGGDVNANGGHGSAGIGGGNQGAGGTVVINNGTVIATGGEWGAGIGSGSSEDNEINGGGLTVNGGAVTAKGGIGAAGIGGGNGAYGATVIANGGVIKTSGGKWELPDDEAEDWGVVIGLSEHNDEDSLMYYYGEGVGQGVLRFEEGETHTENKGTITLGDGMVVYGAATADPETSEANLLTLTDGDYTRYHYMTIIAGAGSPSAVAAPTFSPEGGSYTEAQTVTISCQTEGATIYYTTDGTDPTSSSAQYTTAITVSKTTTLKAIAVKGEASSEVAAATYTIGKLHALTVNIKTQAEAPVTIKLMLGQEQVGASATVDVSDGSFGTPTVYTYSHTFEDVPDGIYNAVATQTIDGETRTVTSAVVLTANDDNKTVTADIPAAKVNSVLEVKDGAPAAVINGLDDEAEINAQAGSTVTYKMEVDDTSTADSAAAQVDKEAQMLVPAGKTLTMTYMDITITKTTTPDGGTPVTEDIHQTSSVIETIFPYAYAADGYTVWMWRNHLGSVSKLTEIAGGSVTGSDGTFWLDKENRLVHLFGRDYSIYAIGYVEGNNVQPATTTGGSVGGRMGDNSTDTYPVNTNAPAGGTVTASHKQAGKDTTITVTATPDKGYELSSVTVTDGNGKEPSVTDNRDGTYSFRMPAASVTITVTFRKFREKPEVTGVSDRLITDEHIVYISGYPDGTAAPQGNITRAEVAMIFYRLLKNKNVEITLSFPDAKEGVWYAEAVNVLGSLGIINGRTDGSFDGGAKITRAEFAAIATRFAYSVEGKSEFSDVPENYWAYGNISTAAAYGWVEGYEDGTFLPKGDITRAEVAAIVNRMLGRAADKAYIAANTDQLRQFPDLQDANKWYYLDMVEATNEHDFTVTDGLETWNP